MIGCTQPACVRVFVGYCTACLATCSRLLGIITKKDVLKHVDQMSHVDIDARIVH